VSAPRVVAVAPGSPAAKAGLAVGDELVAVNGEPPRDLIRFRILTDDAEVSLDVDRGGLTRTVDITKPAGEPLGVEVHSALFDALQTCDNHC
jgi:NifB/MoaA-like Fe-S oxidoreductase